MASVNQVCRACLATKETFSFVLFENVSAEDFCFCTSIEIHENEELPKTICDVCYDLLTKYSEFKKTCIESQNTLQTLKESLKNATNESGQYCGNIVEDLFMTNDDKKNIAIDVCGGIKMEDGTDHLSDEIEEENQLITEDNEDIEQIMELDNPFQYDAPLSDAVLQTDYNFGDLDGNHSFTATSTAANKAMPQNIASNKNTILKPNYQYFNLDGSLCRSDIFFMFINDDVLQLMVSETNRHAEQMIQSDQFSLTSRIYNWKETNMIEMKKFLGLIMLSGIVIFPTLECIWRRDLVYYHPIYKISGISFNRFSLLLRTWNFCDHTNPKNNISNTGKVQPLIDLIISIIKETCNMEENFMHKEVAIPYEKNKDDEGALSKNKNTIKIRKTCSAKGFMQSFSVHINDHTKKPTGKRRTNAAKQSKMFDSPVWKAAAWYKKVAIELVCMAVVENSWMLYNDVTGKKEPLIKFKEKLIECLLEINSYDSEEKNVIANSFHFISKIPLQRNGKIVRRQCIECYKEMKNNEGRKAARNKVKKVDTECLVCKKAFCMNCFENYHKRDIP